MGRKKGGAAEGGGGRAGRGRSWARCCVGQGRGTGAEGCVCGRGWGAGGGVMMGGLDWQVELSWTPVRGQEGATYAVCLSVRATFAGCSQTFFRPARYGDAGGYCLVVAVERCRFCAAPGDRLEAVAAAWETTWLQLWGGTWLRGTDTLPLGQPLDLGPNYVVHPGGPRPCCPLRRRPRRPCLPLLRPALASRRSSALRRRRPRLPSAAAARGAPISWRERRGRERGGEGERAGRQVPQMTARV